VALRARPDVALCRDCAVWLTGQLGVISTPTLPVADMGEAIAFYERAGFGVRVYNDGTGAEAGFAFVDHDGQSVFDLDTVGDLSRAPTTPAATSSSTTPTSGMSVSSTPVWPSLRSPTSRGACASSRSTTRRATTSASGARLSGTTEVDDQTAAKCSMVKAWPDRRHSSRWSLVSHGGHPACPRHAHPLCPVVTLATNLAHTLPRTVLGRGRRGRTRVRP